jgi:hypothetical protein
MTTNGQQAFNPNEHLIKIKTKDGLKDYLVVQWRLVWFRDQCPQGVIKTEPITIDLDRETEEEAYVWNDEKKRSEKVIKRANGFALFHAHVEDGKGGVGEGTKSEKAASFPDYIEKAETGAIGRALAALGYGTQFTGDELEEGHRIVDSPTASTPDDLDIIKAAAKELKLATNANEWMAWKKQVFGREVADQALTPAQKSRLKGAIEQAMSHPPIAAAAPTPTE